MMLPAPAVTTSQRSPARRSATPPEIEAAVESPRPSPRPDTDEEWITLVPVQVNAAFPGSDRSFVAEPSNANSTSSSSMKSSAGVARPRSSLGSDRAQRNSVMIDGVEVQLRNHGNPRVQALRGEQDYNAVSGKRASRAYACMRVQVRNPCFFIRRASAELH
jgi:hypothetical protein